MPMVVMTTSASMPRCLKLNPLFRFYMQQWLTQQMTRATSSSPPPDIIPWYDTVWYHMVHLLFEMYYKCASEQRERREKNQTMKI